MLCNLYFRRLVIDVLGIAALASGLLASYILARDYSRRYLMLIYHAPFRFWRPYLALYDGLNTDYTYELLGGADRFKDYSRFSCLYREKRPHVTGHFTRLWDTYFKQIVVSYGLTVIVSLVLFWSVWWQFVGPFVLVQLATFIYERIFHHQDPAFVSCGLLSILLQDDLL